MNFLLLVASAPVASAWFPVVARYQPPLWLHQRTALPYASLYSTFDPFWDSLGPSLLSSTRSPHLFSDPIALMSELLGESSAESSQLSYSSIRKDSETQIKLCAAGWDPASLSLSVASDVLKVNATKQSGGRVEYDIQLPCAVDSLENVTAQLLTQPKMLKISIPDSSCTRDPEPLEIPVVLVNQPDPVGSADPVTEEKPDSEKAAVDVLKQMEKVFNLGSAQPEAAAVPHPDAAAVPQPDAAAVPQPDAAPPTIQRQDSNVGSNESSASVSDSPPLPASRPLAEHGASSHDKDAATEGATTRLAEATPATA